jgi:hypothetical protein
LTSNGFHYFALDHYDRFAKKSKCPRFLIDVRQIPLASE